MSLDGGDRSPLIETDEVLGDDAMSIISEKVIGADEGKILKTPLFSVAALKDQVELMMEKHMQTASDLEVLESGSDDWHISDWRALERKSYSDYWHLGGYKWYIEVQLRSLRLLKDLGESCCSHTEIHSQTHALHILSVSRLNTKKRSPPRSRRNGRAVRNS